jgi:hypothetical protein
MDLALGLKASKGNTLVDRKGEPVPKPCEAIDGKAII